MALINKNSPFIIAEIGNNHEGSFNLAKKLIIAAAKTGVDAVKFQTFQTEKFINPKDKKKFKKFKRFELTKSEFTKLAKLAKKKGLVFISTPFDLSSAVFLKSLVQIYKISSGDNNYYQLIKEIIKFKKKIIISTGLLNHYEIHKLIIFFRNNKFPLSKVFFLHCVSDYPAKDLEANLLSIKFLKEKYKINVGYSDHTLGIEACIAAAALGAQIIEKHFTINKNYSNFRDHALSADLFEMTQLVKSVRRVSAMLGKYQKKISVSERKNMNSMRRSLYFNKKIKKNEKILEKNLKIVRPFSQVSPLEIKNVINKFLKIDQDENMPVLFKNIKGNTK